MRSRIWRHRIPRAQSERGGGAVRPLGLAAVTIAVAAIAALLGGVLADSRSPASAPPTPTAARAGQALLGELLREISDADTAGYVRQLERRVAARGDDADALALLGFAYQQRARETADPTFYSRSEQALRRARQAGADPGLVTTGLASLAVSRHRFREALTLARRAIRADAEDATAYGALGDALVNLGRYREAFVAFDRMADLSPSIPSYSRVAYARELLGRREAAVEAATLALELDRAVPEHAAAALVQLGNIEFNAGRLGRARDAYAEALAQRPGYVRAEAGIGRVDAALGRYEAAARRLGRVVERLPLPEYAIWLGDALRAAGRPHEARRADRLVQTLERLLSANGVRTELQTALFDLDQGRRRLDALRRAQSAYQAAPSIQSADVLGWALLRNGRCAEARPYSDLALRLGTRDALMFFHRGMIERCLGHPSAARDWFQRALGINPRFSLRWAPIARTHAA